MSIRIALISLVAAIALTSTAAAKEEFGTAKEAEALVANAVAHAKKVGTTKAWGDFTSKAPGWTDRDLYVFVLNSEGVCLAHGQNPKLVGKNVLDLRDADGKFFIKEAIEATKVKPTAWLSYTWNDPVTHKLLAKSTYCENFGANVYCVGIYKR